MFNWNLRSNLPPVNYSEDSSESEEFNSPPPGTPVEDDLQGLGELRNAVDQLTVDQVVNQAAERLAGQNLQEPAVPAQDIPENPPARMVNYDASTGTDDAGALQKAVTQLQNIQFNECDLNFYFNQVELKMRLSGVKASFTKLLVLTSVIPPRVQEEVKYILSMQESDFAQGEMPYLKLKTEILKIFAQTQESAFERAMGRVLSGRPSQLARQLINDLCPKRLDGCCCKNFIVGLWKRALPDNVKASVAHLEFNAQNLEQILTQADKVYQSSRPAVIPTVAELTSSAAPQMPSGAHSLPGPAVLNQAFSEDFQVAAMSSGGRGRWNRGGRGRSGRGNRGGQRGGRGAQSQGQSQGQGGQEHPRHKGPRHPDQPPISSCRRHLIFGKGAHFCEEPGSCPWKNFYVAKANQ